MTQPKSRRVPDDVNYTLSEAEIQAAKAYGEVRHHVEGAAIAAEGDKTVDVHVVLSGQLDVYVADAGEERRVGWMEPGQFSGDLGVITGQVSLMRAEMAKAGDLLHIPRDNFQRLLIENSQLSDVFVRVLSARRAFARSGNVGSTIVIGPAYDRVVFTARDLLTKHNVAHLWLDPDRDELAAKIMSSKQLSKADLPAVVLGRSQVLIHPTVEEMSEAFGFDLLPDGACADVIVVGAGPAGLAASVYAASEGLSVLTLDTDGPGGQAGTSSKIENYLGFPTGVSGRELAERAAIQAQKFGVRIASPAKAASLERMEDGSYCLGLRDGRKLASRAVVIATGAQYRKLPLDRLEDFEGRGIYYGATPMEAQLCSGSIATVVGAGNSAGQGAVFLSNHAKEVHIAYRRPDIRETMSEYLVRRLEETPNIHLHPGAEITALHGNGAEEPSDERLAGITVKSNEGETDYPCPFVFLFIGAAPFTEWLPDGIRRDARGFLKTGTAVENLDLVRAGWDLERMPKQYETSWPRVYAVGDVRTGSVKRVASAVGEGSVVVSDIHSAISELVDPVPG